MPAARGPSSSRSAALTPELIELTSEAPRPSPDPPNPAASKRSPSPGSSPIPQRQAWRRVELYPDGEVVTEVVWTQVHDAE